MGKNSSSEQRVRLNKYIADSGVASRRHADQLIADGSVMVNGKRVYELGVKVDPEVDRVSVKGREIKPFAHKVYAVFNKPRQVVTTMNDPEGRPTVADYFTKLKVRVFPVGRLDFESEGMILLTNDGDFGQRVAHPSQEILKTYEVKVSGQPTEQQLDKLRRGISIIGGKVAARFVEKFRKGSDQYDWLRIMIAEGKNRQIRLMLEKIGFDVMKLRRVAIGRLKLGALKPGEFKVLGPESLRKIFESPLKQEPMPVRAGGASNGPTKPLKRNAKPTRALKKSETRKPRRGIFDDID